MADVGCLNQLKMVVFLSSFISITSVTPAPWCTLCSAQALPSALTWYHCISFYITVVLRFKIFLHHALATDRTSVLHQTSALYEH